MDIKFDINGKMEMPQLTLCNPNGKPLYVMPQALNISSVLRFGSYSDLTFTVPDHINEDYKIPYYHLIQQMRRVEMEGYGVFVIDSISETDDGTVKKKVVECKTIDALFATKHIVEFEGTLPLYDPTGIRESILSLFLEDFPDWKLDYVDSELWNIYRTYNISEDNWYNFINTIVTEDYQCVFEFDTFGKKISVKSVKNAVKKTDIFMSFENLVKHIKVDTVTDGIKTALEVYGADGLSIREVNPLGTSTIYNFDHYKNTEWISQETIDAINLWEGKVSQARTGYANNLATLKLRNSQLIVLNGELTQLITERKAIDNVLASQVAQGGIDTSQKSNEVEAKKAQIKAKELQIEAKETEIANIRKLLNDTHINLSFNKNFTKSQLEEVNSILITGTYTNDAFITTDSMTPNDIQDQAQELYDLALTVLEKESQSRFTFEVDTINVLALKELKEYAKQLELGCEITIGMDDKFFAPVLLEYPISFDDVANSKMVFSNSLRLQNNQFDFADIFNGMQSAVSSVSTSKGLWENYIKSGDKSDVKSLKNDALDLANKDIVSSTGQAPTIDETGIRARKMLANGNYDPKQLWMTNNVIAMTDSNWTKTPKVAIGEISFNGVKKYGVAGDLVVGNLILGENVVVKDKDGTFDITGNLLKISDRNKRERLLLGEYAYNKFGLSLKSATGDVILDEDGILQSWQEGRADNVDVNYPLRLHLYVPDNTKSISKAFLRFKMEKFRAYSTSAASETINLNSTASETINLNSTASESINLNSTASGGGTRVTVDQRNTVTSNTEGHNHGIKSSVRLAIYGGTVEVDGQSVLRGGDGWVQLAASGEHVHTFNVDEHSHSIYMPSHRHSISMPSHNHSIYMPSHSHAIQYGIYEGSQPNGVRLYINGTLRGGAYANDQNSIDISNHLIKGTWNIIELTTTRIGRIDATVFIQALMGT